MVVVNSLVVPAPAAVDAVECYCELYTNAMLLYSLLLRLTAPAIVVELTVPFYHCLILLLLLPPPLLLIHRKVAS